MADALATARRPLVLEFVRTLAWLGTWLSCSVLLLIPLRQLIKRRYGRLGAALALLVLLAVPLMTLFAIWGHRTAVHETSLREKWQPTVAYFDRLDQTEVGKQVVQYTYVNPATGRQEEMSTPLDQGRAPEMVQSIWVSADEGAGWYTEDPGKWWTESVPYTPFSRALLGFGLAFAATMLIEWAAHQADKSRARNREIWAGKAVATA